MQGVFFKAFFRVLFLFCLVGLGNQLILARAQVQVRSIEEKQELVAGKVFLQRYKNLEGVVSWYWFIDGQSVDREIFEEQFSQAVAQDALDELRKNATRAAERQEFELLARNALYKKLAGTLQEEIVSYLVRFVAIDLKPFFVFSSQTFVSRDEFEEACAWVKQDVAEHFENAAGERELDAIVRRFEQLFAKFEQFYQATIKRAIDECSDTRVLKELLSLVS